MKEKSRTFRMLTAVTATAVVASATVPVANAASFSDIADSDYKLAIEELKAQGVIDGYNTGEFMPDKQLKRSDVVKMLGKYLVSLGYAIPSDYKTYMRFSDLTPHSPDELLQYAAVVYDNDIFLGNRGNLLASNKLSMQHMAVVLVRMLSTIDHFDYVDYVKGQRYLKEYLDLEDATTEAQQAINVIDYYDFYKQYEDEAYYYPNMIANRGQFAHFLYHLLEVESPARTSASTIALEHIAVVSPTRLTVTLTDGTVHNVVLDKALLENESTKVTFRVNGRLFKDEVVTYKVQQLEVIDTEFINSGQFVVHFNQKVALKDIYYARDLARIIQLKSANGSYNYALAKGQLSEDGQSMVVTLGQQLSVNTRYTIEILGIHAENGISLVDTKESIYYNGHVMGPAIEKITNLGNSKVRIEFTEPLYPYYSTSSISYRLVDGSYVYGVQAAFEENRYYSSYYYDPYYGYYTYYYDPYYNHYAYYYYNQTTAYASKSVVLDFKDARAAGKIISSSTPIEVSFHSLRDMAGNLSSPNPLVQTITAPYLSTLDGVKPKLLEVEQLGAKQMKLVFSEPIERLGYYDLVFESSKQNYYIENIEQSADQTTFILTMDDYLDGVVRVKSNSSRYIYDLSGERADAINKRVVFKYDPTPAKIVKTHIMREENLEYLFVTFDRNVQLGSQPTVALASGYYEEVLSKNTMFEAPVASVYQHAANEVKIPVHELVGEYDTKSALFTGNLTFEDVYNEYKEEVVNEAIQFTRGHDYHTNTEPLQLLSVETSRTNPSILQSNRILLNFNYAVNKLKAEDLANYALSDYKIQSAHVYASNPKQVELIVSEAVTAPVSPNLTVWDLTAQNAVIPMNTYFGRVPLNETVKPVYQHAVKSGTHEMTITYNEAINTMDANAFIVKTSAGDVLAQTVSNHPTDLSKLVLTFDEQLSAYGTYTVELRAGRVIRDLYGNPADFSKLSISR